LSKNAGDAGRSLISVIVSVSVKVAIRKESVELQKAEKEKPESATEAEER
jgi:hypothetical protein